MSGRRLTAWTAFCCSLLIAAFAATGASAQLRSNWEKRPSHQQLMVAWPAAAAHAGIEGRASMLCEANRVGQISQCHLLNEDPEGAGFGEALLRLTPLFRLRSTSRACAAFFHQVAVEVEWSKTDHSTSWASRPDAKDWSAAYPKAALEAHIWGAAIVSCNVEMQGVVSSCKVVFESPMNQGFGAAALALTPKFRMNTDGGGQSKVLIPINFLPFQVQSGCGF